MFISQIISSKNEIFHNLSVGTNPAQDINKG